MTKFSHEYVPAIMVVFIVIVGIVGMFTITTNFAAVIWSIVFFIIGVNAVFAILKTPVR